MKAIKFFFITLLLAVSVNASMLCQDFFNETQITFTPPKEKKVQGWEYGVNDHFSHHSTNGVFELRYENFSDTVTSLYRNGQKIMGNLAFVKSNFTKDDFLILYEGTVIKRFNLQTLNFESPIKLSKEYRMNRALDKDTFILETYIKDFNYKGPPVLLQMGQSFFGLKNKFTYLRSDNLNLPKDAVQVVTLDPEKKFAAILTTYSIDSGRLHSKYDVEIFDLKRQQTVFTTRDFADFHSDVAVSGVDTFQYLNGQFIVGGFERQTTYMMFDPTQKLARKIKNPQDYLLPVIETNGSTLNVEISLKDKTRKNVQIDLKGFLGFGWSLQEKFQYSFLRDNTVLLITENNHFVGAVDLIAEKTISYDQINHFADRENTLLYQLNMRTPRWN